MISTSAYSELLAILYAAALDETQWQRFLERLCEITGSIAARFVRNDSTSGVRLLTMGPPMMEQVDEAYHSSYRYTDPLRQAYMRNSRVGLIEGEDLAPHTELLKTEVFQAVAVSYGLVYVSLLMISISPRSQEMISIWRGAGRPLLEREHRDLVEMLLPHLQNVLKIRRALALAEDRARNAETMLDASATASILLDKTGYLIYMNDAAHNLARASDGLKVRNRRLVPTDPSKLLEFTALVAGCITADSRGSGGYGGALMLARPSCRRPLQVFVSPLRLTDPHRSGVRALVLATDPSLAVTFPNAILRQLYGLTPAETEVANGLLTGCSPEEIARLRKVSITTIRSQMSSLLAKTRTRRQGDLLLLLAALPKTVPQQNLA